jgi:hypothetical protein
VASVMDRLLGMRPVVSPLVPDDRLYLVYPGDPARAVVLYRDRYALMRALFWARVGPRLEGLADKMERDFRGDGAMGTGWYCGVCRLCYPAAAEETTDGCPQCPTCGAALRPYSERNDTPDRSEEE